MAPIKGPFLFGSIQPRLKVFLGNGLINAVVDEMGSELLPQAKLFDLGS